ncbi:DUF2399 domain-containing protein [Streptomyces sp. NPDC090021]|uniref:DUF2399 domain-containing protein n=1 Tax=Streptomyces sp. NPDC090021 TaxID=3365919 RepID=UPI00382DDD09
MTTTPSACPRLWCPEGACRNSRLDTLLIPDAQWLWEQIADRADKRGDPHLASGSTVITAPDAAVRRAAVRGLTGSRVLAPGERRRISLDELALRLRRHGAHLTPGAVAAHAVGRSLGRTAGDKARQAARIAGLRKLRARLAAALPAAAPVRPADEGWGELHRTGRVARILQHPTPEQLLTAAAEVLRLLPRHGRIDRRVLAHRAVGDPHALDAGTELAGLVLAEAATASITRTGIPPRQAWNRLGIDLDSLGGGLLSLGVHPDGWSVPARHPLVLPPFTLAATTWPSPTGQGDVWVFVTENPSVVAAALALPTGIPVRMLCTVGTPSAAELHALTCIATSGWRIAVRADFDSAGIQHVRAVLDAVPGAQPWRMNAESYTRSLHPDPLYGTELDLARLPDTEWDPTLQAAMHACGRPAYEEALLDQLVEDLRHGHPPL